MHRRQEKSTLHFLQFLRLHSTALQFCNFIGFSTLFFLETAPGVGDNPYSLTTALTSTAYDRTHRVTATPGFLFFQPRSYVVAFGRAEPHVHVTVPCQP